MPPQLLRHPPPAQPQSSLALPLQNLHSQSLRCVWRKMQCNLVRKKTTPAHARTRPDRAGNEPGMASREPSPRSRAHLIRIRMESVYARAVTVFEISPDLNQGFERVPPSPRAHLFPGGWQHIQQVMGQLLHPPFCRWPRTRPFAPLLSTFAPQTPRVHTRAPCMSSTTRNRRRWTKTSSR